MIPLFFYLINKEIELRIITKSNRTRLLMGVLLILLLAAGIAAAMPWIRVQTEALFLPGENSPQWAARHGAEAFYTLDYRETPDIWVDVVCSVSTEGGCALAEMAAPNLWEALIAAKTHTRAQVKVIGEVKDKGITSFSENLTQIWEVHITLSEPLPGQTLTEDIAYAVVVQEGGAWKFERVLMNAETADWNNAEGVELR